MLKINKITKKFDDVKALDNVSAYIKKGTIHGLIGENGAGKTTLLQIVSGIYHQDDGKILINNESVYENNKIKSKIGYVTDNNQFFPYYKVKEIVAFFAGIYKTFSKDKFNALNKILNVPDNKRINQLSKGTKMRLSLMLNMSINPELLLLDEPTSGLDPIAKKEIIDMLIDEVEKNKCTILISSHHLSELEKLCDDITILNHGKVTYQSSIESIKNNVKKLQVLFEFEPNLSDVNEILKVEKLGSIYYIITKKYNEEIKEKLIQKGAKLIEEVGISLEEIFIYTNSKKGSEYNAD